MIWTKKFCEKMSHYFETPDQSFRKEPWVLAHNVNQFQKILREVNGHEKKFSFTNMTFFALAIFWSVGS